MTTGKVIIHEDRDVQPIVPLGLLIEKMGCEVTWAKKGACRLRHPTVGEIPVQTNAGCPEVEKGVALALIDALEELEEGRDAKLNKIKEEDRVVELIRSERAFNGVPGEVMEKVVIAPAKDLSGLPLNRPRRRKLQEGFVVHLYAGEEEGYTLSRALKEVGGDKTRLVEIDLKRGADHDMMKDEVYAALMVFSGLPKTSSCSALATSFIMPGAHRDSIADDLTADSSLVVAVVDRVAGMLSWRFVTTLVGLTATPP